MCVCVCVCVFVCYYSYQYYYYRQYLVKITNQIQLNNALKPS